MSEKLNEFPPEPSAAAASDEEEKSLLCLRERKFVVYFVVHVIMRRCDQLTNMKHTRLEIYDAFEEAAASQLLLFCSNLSRFSFHNKRILTDVSKASNFRNV